MFIKDALTLHPGPVTFMLPCVMVKWLNDNEPPNEQSADPADVAAE